MIEINIKIIILMILRKDDIEIKLYLSNIIYVSNINLNLFSFMMIYDKEYEIRMTSGYNVKIFYEEILVTEMFRWDNT